ncbi:SDR family NAD(P)-dependent oxidoreductase [Limnohabitans sp.]|uniref:SDR family NAD(P)-dependent oxidoreductase n=1 Tax=Limnohabitans sp. TaxID=1907725 RepID=UPI00286F5E9F|nr:SDR family NAD(P)-dependent oxidoreductase [Limnohabitans sp.]
MKSLVPSYRALVLGASGALGAAFVEALQADDACAEVVGLSRSSQPSFRLEDEASMALAATAVQGPFHLIIDATGALTIGGHGPEKHMGALNALQLARAFEVNTIGPALLLKHFVPLLATDQRCIYAKLSARVGSISDNRKGGWHGYRAAKAALNMVLQTAAIEASRKRPQLVVAAMQPGTVASNLSAPFVPAKDCLTPAQSVAGLLGALDALPAQAAAHFVDHQGEAIAW